MSEQPPQNPDSGWTPPGGMPQAAPPPPYGAPQPPMQQQPGYPYPPAPYPGMPVPPREPSKTMAIIALILAILPCGITWIVAVVLAIIVLVQVKKGTARGRGLAIAALVISVLWILVAGVALAFGVADEVNKDKARDAGSGKIDVVDLKVGDCLANPTSEENVRTVKITPCANSHHGEVFATFSVDASDEPTQDEIMQLSSEGCVRRFKDFVGVRFGTSKLEFTYIYPAKELLKLNDKAICIVSLPKEAPTTGTLKGSNR